MKIREKEKKLIKTLRKQNWKVIEIANLLGITPGRVSQILKVATRKSCKNQKSH